VASSPEIAIAHGGLQQQAIPPGTLHSSIIQVRPVMWDGCQQKRCIQSLTVALFGIDDNH